MKKTIGIIGAGNMGAAIISGIRGTYAVRVCESRKKQKDYLRKAFKLTTFSLEKVVKESDVVIVAVKPQDIGSILEKVGEVIDSKKIVVSIAAGITTSYIEKKLPAKSKVVRVMPNLPVQVDRGMSGLCKGKHTGKADITAVRKIFQHVGLCVEVKEKDIDAVTAVSGSGPAYVFLFLECFIQAAQECGLIKKIAEELVMQTVQGSLGMIGSKGIDPKKLRKAVTSKGGTTEAALEVFEKSGFDKTFIKATKAAMKRARTLSKK